MHTRMLALAALAALIVAPGALALEVGDPAPDFAGTWINHDPTSLAELRGRPVLVEFWQTW